jgi:4-hydroxybenzoate polyprenyltransferase
MVVARPKLVAYAQLMRLPNVFTAVADPLAGWFVVGGGDPSWHLALLAGAGGCLYTSGIVFNDYFDYELDCLERPERPLPSGAISRTTAAGLGAALMAVGLAFAGTVGTVAFGIAAFIAAMVFFYNAWAKRFAVLGPLVIGTCRFANFLLGMRCCPPRLWLAPAALGVYCTTLTWVARNEAINVKLRMVVKQMLLGIIVVDALTVLLLRGDGVGALIVLSLIIPAMTLGKIFAMT